MREFVDPVIRSLYPIPGIAWIPLAILWFGLGNTAVVFVVFIAEFFPLYFNTEAGARNINPVLVDAARCYGAKGVTLLRRVILPASTPYIITGMRIALGGAWRMIVAGEMLASQSGIGSILMESRYQFRATDLMMAMILISIVGYITERLIVGTLEKKTDRTVGSEGPLASRSNARPFKDHRQARQSPERRGRRDRQRDARLCHAQRSWRGARGRPPSKDGRRQGLLSRADRGRLRPSLSADPAAGLGLAEANA